MAANQTSISLTDNALITGGHFIDVEGINLYYRTGGSGPCLLLLHGITLSSEQWSPFLDSFAKYHTVIAPDFPGHGKSDRLTANFSFEKWADLVLKMLDKLGLNKIQAIGHSAGAHTLLHMTRENPELIESMILVCGAHRSTRGVADELRNDSFDKAEKPLRDYYLHIHHNDMDRITAMFGDVRHMSQTMPVVFDDAGWTPKSLSEITTPVYLIWGDGDDLFPIETAVELYRNLPNSRLWVIPGQGHTPIWPIMGGDESAAAAFPEIAEQFFSAYGKPLTRQP